MFRMRDEELLADMVPTTYGVRTSLKQEGGRSIGHCGTGHHGTGQYDTLFKLEWTLCHTSIFTLICGHDEITTHSEHDTPPRLGDTV